MLRAEPPHKTNDGPSWRRCLEPTRRCHFQGIEQAKSPDNVRELALAIIAAALPFQAIYFLIYTFVLEHEPATPTERMRKPHLASALCQVVSYASLGGVALMWYNMSSWVGLSFGVSSIFAIVLIRNVMAPVDALSEDAGTPQNPPHEHEWEG